MTTSLSRIPRTEETSPVSEPASQASARVEDGEAPLLPPEPVEALEHPAAPDHQAATIDPAASGSFTVIDEDKIKGRVTRVKLKFDARNASVVQHKTQFAIAQGPSITTWRQRLHKLIIGTPIPQDQAMHERIGRFRALAILSSDALSSTAYGTEASLAILAPAGAAALSKNIWLGLAIILLLAIVAISYRQTIHHYPNGGGSYIVAKENLNIHFGLFAAAALLIDYILTVSVSVSAGIDALGTAIPIPAPVEVFIGVSLIIFMMLVNLRGVRDSGMVFALPTYLFVGSYMLMITVGIWHAFTQGGLLHPLPPAITPLNQHVTENLSAFLVLTAFASGCSAMTGTEAISNGVPIFKAPQARNASQTLSAMALLLGIMYGGTTYLAWRFGISPFPSSHPTVIGQMASMFFTGWFGWFFYVFQGATMLILVLAANTSFADFPRLSALLAKDDYLPHLFKSQGDRLAFEAGIIVLGVLAIVLYTIFQGNTDALIQLYALGVFAAFTCSQAGMVLHWRRHASEEPHWRRGMAINALGAIATGVVMLIIAATKFIHGAWVVVILIPGFYFFFQAVFRHYQKVNQQIKQMEVRTLPQERHVVIVPIADMSNLALQGLRYARLLSRHVKAVFVSSEQADLDRMSADWNERINTQHVLRDAPTVLFDVLDDDPLDDTSLNQQQQVDPSGMELMLINSPYRTIVVPILSFVDTLHAQHPNDIITLVLPEYVTLNPWESMLHNQTVLRLKIGLLSRPYVVTANVPYRPELAKTIPAECPPADGHGPPILAQPAVEATHE